MRLLNLIVNSLWVSGTFKDFLYYKKNLSNVSEIQKKKLCNIIQKNRNTLFCKYYQFEKNSDVKDYQKCIPISNYNSYIPWIEKIIEGKENVLTSERVLILQPTGGTSSGSKLIPYTKSLQEEFQKAINPWLFGIFRNLPETLAGKSYWSISPVLMEKKDTKSGIPIGFEDDTDYVGWKGNLIRKVFSVPSGIKEVKNTENFWYLTSYFLLQIRDLAIISVWSPSFLIMILKYIEKYSERLLKNIHEGKLTLPFDEKIDFITSSIRPAPKRAKELAEIFHLPVTQRYSRIWPILRLISCWKDGPSRYHAEKLSKIFPNIFIQGKGLIATEAIITFPLFEVNGNVPAYTSHFFEFMSDSNENVHLIHELDTGGIYTVIITTSGGLYRYNLEDKVKVIGKFRELPILEFIGRTKVSDMVGEKLEESHVQRVIKKSFEHLRIGVRFVLLAPYVEKEEVGYTLFIEPKEEITNNRIEEIKKEVEKGLKENFHYWYARDLGQILPIKVFLIKSNGAESYFKRCIEEGQKIGEIKQVALDNRTGWEQYFEGNFLEIFTANTNC